jgi:Mn2+/Fe2+ NRAMP family transporter
MGWEAGIDKTAREAPQFAGVYTAFIALGSLIVMFPGVPLIAIMWSSQVVNGIMLPFVLVYMLKLVNDSELMHGFTNSRFANAVAWITAVVMMALTGALIVSAFVA